MPLFDDKDTSVLKQYLENVLEKMSDADSNILSEYVIVLLQHEKTEEELYEICLVDLQDFLGQETEEFVKLLFTVLHSKEYLKEKSGTSKSNLAPSVNERLGTRNSARGSRSKSNSRSDSSNPEKYSRNRNFGRERDSKNEVEMNISDKYKDSKKSDKFSNRGSDLYNEQRGYRDRSGDRDRNRERAKGRNRSLSRSRGRSRSRSRNRGITTGGRNDRERVPGKLYYDSRGYYDNKNFDSGENESSQPNTGDISSQSKDGFNSTPQAAATDSYENNDDEPYDPEDAFLNQENDRLEASQNIGVYGVNNVNNNSRFSNFNQAQLSMQNPMMAQGLRPIPDALGVNVRMGMGVGVGVGAAMGMGIRPGMNIGMGMNPAMQMGNGMPAPYVNPMMRPMVPLPGRMMGVHGVLGFGQPQPQQRPQLQQNFKQNQSQNQRQGYRQNSNKQPYSSEGKFNKGSQGQYRNNDRNSLNAPSNADEKAGAVSDGQYVIESIPLESLNRPAIEGYFRQFGEVKSIDIDIDSKSALVTFLNPQDGMKAYKSPEAILGNRFVKIRKRRPQQTEQLKPHVNQEDTQEIRKNYIAHQKHLLEINEKKQKLVESYMEKQKALMQKLVDPEYSAKLTKEAAEEIKSSIKKIQELIKETLSISLPGSAPANNPVAQPNNFTTENKWSDSTASNNFASGDSYDQSFSEPNVNSTDSTIIPSSESNPLIENLNAVQTLKQQKWERQPMKLDFRPRTLLVESLPSLAFDEIKLEFEKFGVIESCEDSTKDGFLRITYSQRWEAEKAFKDVKVNEKLSQVVLTWVSGAANNESSSNPNKSSGFEKNSSFEKYTNGDESNLGMRIDNSDHLYDGPDYHDSMNDDERSWKL